MVGHPGYPKLKRRNAAEQTIGLSVPRKAGTNVSDQRHRTGKILVGLCVIAAPSDAGHFSASEVRSVQKHHEIGDDVILFLQFIQKLDNYCAIGNLFV